MDPHEVRLKAGLVIKTWLMKKTFHPPEIKRATTVMLHSDRFARKRNCQPQKMSDGMQEDEDEEGKEEEAMELTAQETSCLSAIAALQWWVQLDPTAAADIEAEFARFAFQSLVENKEVSVEGSAESIFVIDISKSMANILAVVRRQSCDASKPQLFGKTGFRSVYLSKLLAPGQLVKDVKVALSGALILEGEDHKALDTSLDAFSASVDLTGPISRSTVSHLGTVLHPANNSVSKHGSTVMNNVTLESFFDDDDFSSDTDSDGVIEGEREGEGSGDRMVIRLVDNAERRRSSVVAPPRLPRGREPEEGRVSRWQEDEARSQRGKEHAARMDVSRNQEAAARRMSVGLPSPPKGQMSSIRYHRHHTTLKAGVAPGLRAEAALHSTPDSLPTSADRELTSEVPSFTAGEESSTPRAGSRSLQLAPNLSILSMGDSIGSLSVERKPAGRRRTRAAGREGRSIAEVVETETDMALPSRPQSISGQRVLMTPPEVAPSLEGGSLERGTDDAFKPRSFALQMINELTELRGRGEEITAEESARLMYINKAIMAIVEQETGEVDGISARLDSIRVEEKEEEVKADKGKEKRSGHRDPLAPLPCPLLLLPSPRTMEDSCGLPSLAPPSDLVSYKRFAAYHQLKHLDVLSELAAREFS